MGKGLAKRRKLFCIGARAVAMYCRMEEDLYICPICGTGYPRGAAEDGTLSLEHVPPKSAGGKPLVLTCRRCNSEAGESIDSAEARRQNMQAVLGTVLGRREEALPRCARMTVHGNIVRIEISQSGGTTQLRPVAEASHPRALQHVEDYFKEHARHGTGDGDEITITVERKDFRRLAQISDLKTGFLAAFAFLGYRFALHPNLAPVRRQIREPSVDIIGTRFHTSFTDKKPMKLTLMAATEPFPCIAAILRNRCVLMPEPDGPGNLYDMLAGLEDHGVSLRGKTLGWPTSMELRLDRTRGIGS